MIATEIRLRAERKWGQMYRQAEKAARGPDHEGKGSQRSGDSTAEKLEKLGVTKDQSSQWQKLADEKTSNASDVLLGKNAIGFDEAVVLGRHGGKREQGSNTTLTGRGADYQLARLRRDRPDLAEIRDFCEWWREKVRGDGRPSKTVADRGQLSATDAESLTGITKQQVSRWAKVQRAGGDRQSQKHSPRTAGMLALDLLPHFEAEAKKRMLAGVKADPTERIPEGGSVWTGEAREQAADAVGVNPRYVSDAKRTGKQGGSRFAEFAKARFGMAKARASMWVTIGENIKLFSNAEQFSADWTAFYEFTRLEVVP